MSRASPDATPDADTLNEPRRALNDEKTVPAQMYSAQSSPSPSRRPIPFRSAFGLRSVANDCLVEDLGVFGEPLLAPDDPIANTLIPQPPPWTAAVFSAAPHRMPRSL